MSIESNLIVVKRSGQRVPFNGTKVALAIKGAFDSVDHTNNSDKVYKVYRDTLKFINKNYKDRKTINVEDIQDIIEQNLRANDFTDVYEAFTTYRVHRAASRETSEEKKQHKFMRAVEALMVEAEQSEGDNPIENLYDLGSIVSSEFSKAYLIDNKYTRAHSDGVIHINNLESYELGAPKALIMDASRCCGKGHLLNRLETQLLGLREEVYGEITVADFDLAIKGCLEQHFKEKFIDSIEYALNLVGFIEYLELDQLEAKIREAKSIEREDIVPKVRSARFQQILDAAYTDVRGAIDEEFRTELSLFFTDLDSTHRHFKVHYAFSISANGGLITDLITSLFSKLDLQNLYLIIKHTGTVSDTAIEAAASGRHIRFENVTNTPDLEYLASGARIYENGSSEKKSKGRLVLADASINLPRLAYETGSEVDFMVELDKVLDLAKSELKDSYAYITNKTENSYHYLFKDNIVSGCEKLEHGQKIRKAVKNGTLNISLIGLAEAATVLKKDYSFGLEVLEHIRDRLKAASEEDKYIFTFSEIDSGSPGATYFVETDRSIFGSAVKTAHYHGFTELIKDLKIEPRLDAFEKYQALTTGGHILKISPSELQAALKRNIKYMEVDLC